MSSKQKITTFILSNENTMRHGTLNDVIWTLL